MESPPPSLHPVYGAAGPQEALRQVVNLIEQAADLRIQCSHDGTSFQSETSNASRFSVRGKLVANQLILARFELLRADASAKSALADLWGPLSSFSERIRLLPPEHDAATDEKVYGVELRVMAEPMSLARSSAFHGELKNLVALGRALQSSVPLPLTDASLRKRFEPLADYLEPVYPWQGEIDADLAPMWEWALESIDYLNGASSVALASFFPVAVDFALAVLACVGQQQGRILGALSVPAIGTRDLIDLSRKAPGTVVVPASRLSLGSNPYEVEREVPPLLGALSAAGRPALFTGSYVDLQAVFQGGQGGQGDPLQPVVRRVPGAVPFGVLARFAVRAAARLVGGLPQAAEDALTDETIDAFHLQSPADRLRLLPAAAQRAVRAWEGGLSHAAPASSFVSRACALSESFAGLSDRPRVSRAPSVQQRFVERLVDPDLPGLLQVQLLGQEAALAALVARLRMECLTRPLHQPVRYIVQGTPGTGKSQSAVLLARWLGVPYVNIDAASMPDHHTAASQLLGSGRGIVGSYQSGRLEQAAKHHTGAVLEVSDLDHAAPSVRAILADLFLQVLETGEAQSAKGAMFSCANLIIGFTMNLPEGRDEAVRRGVGFGTPSRREIRHRVASEIRKMFSGAFLSRVGTPILFAPLDGPVLASILEQAVEAALRAAATHLQVPLAEVVLSEGMGARLAASLEGGVLSSGARVLAEHGRTLAAQSFLALLARDASLEGRTLCVECRADASLILDIL